MNIFIQLIYVDSESISFYDESHALFQGDEENIIMAEMNNRNNYNGNILA